jgi:hypothetical protein
MADWLRRQHDSIMQRCNFVSLDAFSAPAVRVQPDPSSTAEIDSRDCFLAHIPQRRSDGFCAMMAQHG